MAEFGRREVVSDPLANAGSGQASRMLGLSGVSNPNQSGGQVNDGTLVNLLGGVQQVLAGELEKQRDEEITRGKIAFMGGITDASLIANGNKYTARGYETLNAMNRANDFYQNELLSLENGGQEMDPAAYQQALMDKRAKALADLPEDPAVRKVYVAAFEDLGPKLAGAQLQANNQWNKGRKLNEFTNALVSTSGVAGNTPHSNYATALAISGEPVSTPVDSGSTDRDVAIRTMLGEAANQGEQGLAGVAWVLRNRRDTGKWGSTIADVALADKQFSAWNSKDNGGNDLVSKYGPGTPQYERAGKVYDAVMGGYTVDMTGGATHYFSESGMFAAGDADGKPSWYADEKAKAGGEIKIGGHTFLGRIVGGVDGVAVSEGVETKAATGTDARSLLDSVQGFRPEEKATAVASALALQLDQGGDALWNSLGGLSVLYELNATPQQIASVYAARERFKTEQASKFDLAQEAENEDVLAGIASGSITREQAESYAEGKYNAGQFNDQQATSFIRQAYGELSKKGYTSAGQDNPAYMDELAGLSENMRLTPGMTVSDIAPQIAALSAKYGVDQKETDLVLGRMDAIRQQRDVSLQNDIQTALTAKAKEDGIKELVKTSLANGSGLDDIEGTVSVPNANGTVSKLSAKQWGIEYARQQIAQDLQWQVQSGQLDTTEAAAKMDDTLYAKLAKQGVVDEKFGQTLASAGSGNIIGKEGPSESAIMAFEWYQRMTQNPDVGQAYVDKMIPSGDAKMLFAQAAAMDDGRGNSAETLRKAYEALHNPSVDLNYNPIQDPEFRVELDKQLDEALSETTGGIGQMLATASSQFGFGGPSWSNEDVEYLKSNTAIAKLYLEKQALASYRNWPAASPVAHLKIAMSDLKNNMRIVGGDMIIGPPGRNLNDDMGLSSAGPDAPQRAVTQYLLENGEAYWGDEWKALMSKNTVAGVITLDTTQQVPDFSAQYNFATKRLEIRLWADDTRQTPMYGKDGKLLLPLSLDATNLGKEFIEKGRQIGILEMLGGAVTGAAADTQIAGKKTREGLPEYSDNPMEPSQFGAMPQ